MSAYYNEIDPFAAAWLRELIKAGHIASGVVDERSIENIKPDNLRGFTQCHFFAGIGVWSHALRRAGWPDDRPVWTGSCPCQPFSTAGKGSGFVDERHLWPHWFHLITQCNPRVVFGEQVASKDGLGWLDLVQTDLEGAGYASGTVDLCAAGVGAPHIRQRLWFVAERLGDTGDARLQNGESETLEREGWRQERGTIEQSIGTPGRLAKSESIDSGAGLCSGEQAERGWDQHSDSGRTSGLADTECDRPHRTPGHASESGSDGAENGVLIGSSEGLRGSRTGPTNGLWGDADWLFCRDGKWRPVEPGTFPLANGAPSRVGRLRAYGNAINVEVATTFIEAVMS